MKRKVQYRRNSLSGSWLPVDFEVDLYEVAELNRAHGWQKFRIVEVDDETEQEKASADTVPEVPELRSTRMDSA